MKRLKAYEVRNDYADEGGCVIEFATNCATARREGASAMDADWTDVTSCRRAPQFDAYAPGPVPPLILIENGWWFECLHCSVKVDSDGEAWDDEGELLPPLEPVAHGLTGVFCSPACCGKHGAEMRMRAAAKVALCELVQTRHPEAEIIRAHVYGDHLQPEHGYSVATFRLPGLQHSVEYHFGDTHYWVARGDQAEFARLYGAT
jgi:hypothetical protein